MVQILLEEGFDFRSDNTFSVQKVDSHGNDVQISVEHGFIGNLTSDI